MKKRTKKKGFTLIELIVVIAILGILAAVAIPRLSGLQGNANRKAVTSNLKTINNAISTYAADNNVELTAVTKANLETALLTTWPTGPKGVTYTIEASGSAYAGEATAHISTDIPGFTGGTTCTISTVPTN